MFSLSDTMRTTPIIMHCLAMCYDTFLPFIAKSKHVYKTNVSVKGGGKPNARIIIIFFLVLAHKCRCCMSLSIEWGDNISI